MAIPKVENTEALSLMAEDFCDAVLHGKEPVSNWQTGLDVAFRIDGHPVPLTPQQHLLGPQRFQFTLTQQILGILQPPGGDTRIALGLLLVFGGHQLVTVQ